MFQKKKVCIMGPRRRPHASTDGDPTRAQTSIGRHRPPLIQQQCCTARDPVAGRTRSQTGTQREHRPLSEVTARYSSYKCNTFSGPILWPHAADGRDPRARDPTRDPRRHNPPYPTLHGRWRIRSLNCPTWGRNGRGGKGVALPSKCPLFCQPRY